ncbi:hypothetical protein CYMTET_47654 [Cymbomonas tetramitiformis]|uniref:Secreted protein n=1 Tax=Cymbomonas tetramitiformis TaxID=36881 RepID=A0AAE0BTR2_9CHLO|nr:hypothetical protein CYMTET_47654 [Cymbomonas tetramitiformis]
MKYPFSSALGGVSLVVVLQALVTQLVTWKQHQSAGQGRAAGTVTSAAVPTGDDEANVQALLLEAVLKRIETIQSFVKVER